MAIERLSFPLYLNIEAGIEITSQDLENKFDRILRRFGNRARRLVEGEYNLTPSIWTKHLHNHFLTVLDNGTAIYRLIPRDIDVGSVELEMGTLTEFKPGGRVVRIPEDIDGTVVAGPNRLRKGICLYEIIRFTPGPNPI